MGGEYAPAVLMLLALLVHRQSYWPRSQISYTQGYEGINRQWNCKPWPCQGPHDNGVRTHLLRRRRSAGLRMRRTRAQTAADVPAIHQHG